MQFMFAKQPLPQIAFGWVTTCIDCAVLQM